MSPIIFALITFFGWGAGEVLAAITSRKIGSYSLTFWEYVITLVLSSFYLPFVLHNISHLTPYLLLLTLLLGVVFLIATVTYYEALRVGNPSLIVTIVFSFSALVVIFSVIFLKETLVIKQIFSMILIFLGLFLSSFDFQLLSKDKISPDKGILLAFLAMFLYAIYFTFIKIPVQSIGWFLPTYIGLLLFPLVSFFANTQKIKIRGPNFKNVFLLLLGTILLLRLGDFSYNVAVDTGLTAIVAPIAGASPILSSFLAFLIFKEPLKKQQILGIITTLAGIVLLSFFSA